MKNQQRNISTRSYARMFFFTIFFPFLPLLISWRWGWWEAWLFAVFYILGFTISRVLAAKRHPDLLAERTRFTQHENVEPWDRLLAPLIGVNVGVILLVAGLDALFDLSPSFGLIAKMVSFGVILIGFVLGSYALTANPYFSSVVRIQTDRSHKVVSSGPYRWVRHPGYAGTLMSYLATPIFLDSHWAFLPTVFLATVIVVRTELEDRALQNRLKGYRDYARRVHYRLLPGVW